MTLNHKNSHVMFSQKYADANTIVRLHVAVLVRNSNGAILMEKRQDCGLWGIPGGKVEPGESVCQAACREIMEETGLSIKVIRLLGIYSDPIDRILTYPDNIIHVVDVLLEADLISGEIKLSNESEDMRFLELENLPHEEEIIPAGRVMIKDIIDNKIGVIR